MQELDFISDYLIENCYTDSYEDSLNLISVMSDEWMYDILEAKRDPFERDSKGKVVRTHKGLPVLDLGVNQRRIMQGMHTPERVLGHGGHTFTGKRHPQGGRSVIRDSETGATLTSDNVGSQRGKKKQRGAKPGTNVQIIGGKKVAVTGPKKEETPVQKFLKQRRDIEDAASRPRSKYFPDNSRTRLEVLRGRRAARLAAKSKKINATGLDRAAVLAMMRRGKTARELSAMADKIANKFT